MIKQLILKSKYGNFDCIVNYTHYADGNKAITLTSDTGSPIAKATVNMPEMEEQRLEFLEEKGELDNQDEFVFIKNYAENEGMLDSLKDAGFILHEIAEVGHVSNHNVDIALVKLTPMAMEGWK
tara:strand:- start:743 stop:1114 length:372 start_codon:yes stop_codon:yes gene_type:complete